MTGDLTFVTPSAASPARERSVAGAGRDGERLAHGRLEFGRPGALAGEHERRLLHGLERLGIGDERPGALVDRGAEPFERLPVAEDVEVDAGPGVAWSRPVAVSPIAVGMSARSSQPASPATMSSIRTLRTVSSVAMPWKSAGVGAGGGRGDGPAADHGDDDEHDGRERQEATGRGTSAARLAPAPRTCRALEPGAVRCAPREAAMTGSKRRPWCRGPAVALMTGLAVVATATATATVLPAPALAVETSQSSNHLDQPMADVAILAPDGPDGPPRLLVVDAIEPSPTGATIRVLERARAGSHRRVADRPRHRRSRGRRGSSVSARIGTR